MKTNRFIQFVLGAVLGLWFAASAQALSLADISGQEAGGGLKEALSQGASKAVDLLGRKFLPFVQKAIAEEEITIRENPVGAAGSLAQKVFGALK